MYLDLKNNKDYIKLIEPAQIIKNGGLVIFPTETVYGIGANGLNKNAIKKIYEAKQRPLNKPISLLVSNIDMIESVAKDITDIEYAIIKKFFPGPLTIILKKKETIPDILTAGSDTIGIRMPANDIALKEYRKNAFRSNMFLKFLIKFCRNPSKNRFLTSFSGSISCRPSKPAAVSDCCSVPENVLFP